MRSRRPPRRLPRKGSNRSRSWPLSSRTIRAASAASPGSVADPSAEQAEGPRRRAPHRLVKGALVEGGHVLGAERGVVGGCGEGPVQLGGADAEQVTEVEVRAVDPGHRLGDRGVEHVERVADRRDRPGGPFVEGAAVEPAQRIEAVFPEVALVGHVLVDQRHRHRGLPVDAVVDGAEEGGDVGELLGGEELGHLEVGVHPWLEAPEDLHDRPVPEHDRRVALLGPHHLTIALGQLRGQLAQQRGWGTRPVRPWRLPGADGCVSVRAAPGRPGAPTAPH